MMNTMTKGQKRYSDMIDTMTVEDMDVVGFREIHNFLDELYHPDYGFEKEIIDKLILRLKKTYPDEVQ